MNGSLQGRKESNLCLGFWRPLFYRWTTALSLFMVTNFIQETDTLALHVSVRSLDEGGPPKLRPYADCLGIIYSSNHPGNVTIVRKYLPILISLKFLYVPLISSNSPNSIKLKNLNPYWPLDYSLLPLLTTRVQCPITMRKLLSILFCLIFLNLASPIHAEDRWIKLISPNGGESFKEDDTVTITWDSSPNIDKVTPSVYVMISLTPGFEIIIVG